MRVERFRARIAVDSRGHAVITVPFDPDGTWGAKAVHHVSGTVNGCRVRVTLAPGDSGWAFALNPVRMRDTGIAAGSDVIVELAPEGPQRADLADDIAAALAATPAVGPASARWRSSTAGGLPAVHRCDDPPAGPARVAYRRGGRPARGRDQRTAATVSPIAGARMGSSDGSARPRRLSLPSSSSLRAARLAGNGRKTVRCRGTRSGTIARRFPGGMRTNDYA